MMKKFFIIFIFYIFAQSASAADKQTSELNNLFTQLKAISNAEEAKKVEDKIWNLWTTHPSEESLTELLAKGSEYMMQNQLTSAHNVFSKVIELDPKWAEGWNKRATVLYMMGEFQKSQDDIDKVLALEARHFGALAGQGLVNIKLENYEKAIESYERAKEIYPSMESPKIMIKKIQELIKQELI